MESVGLAWGTCLALDRLWVQGDRMLRLARLRSRVLPCGAGSIISTPTPTWIESGGEVVSQRKIEVI